MSDTKKEIFCPACNEKMVKIYTKTGINIDICLNGCGGIWFDNREIESFSKSEENYEEIQEVFDNKTYSKVQNTEQRVCPVCGSKMIEHKANSDSEVDIDECYSCGGKFLDYGELEKIKNSQSTQEEKIKVIFDSLYRQNSNVKYNANQNSVKTFLSNIYKNRMK